MFWYRQLLGVHPHAFHKASSGAAEVLCLPPRRRIACCDRFFWPTAMGHSCWCEARARFVLRHGSCLAQPIQMHRSPDCGESRSARWSQMKQKHTYLALPVGVPCLETCLGDIQPGDPVSGSSWYRVPDSLDPTEIHWAATGDFLGRSQKGGSFTPKSSMFDERRRE